MGQRAAAAHAAAGCHHQRPVPRPAPGDTGGASARRRRGQPRHAGARARADRRGARPGRERGPDHGGQRRNPVQPPAGTRRGLPRRPVHRARRGPPDDGGHAPRTARPLRLAPGGSRTGTRRARGRAAGGNRRPSAAPRRRRRRRPRSRARRRTQPGPARPGAATAGRRRTRPPDRAGGLGAGTGGPGPHADHRPRTTHHRPLPIRLGTHLVQPAHRRAPRAHLRRRAGIGPATGHSLERHRTGRDGRLPLRNHGRPPGRAHHLRPHARAAAAEHGLATRPGRRGSPGR